MQSISKSETTSDRIGGGAVIGKPAKAFARAPKVRRESGWKLLEERFEEIAVLAEDYVRVPSRSREGHAYTVNPARGFCPCRDAQLGGNICSHVEAAQWAAMIASSGYRIEKRFNSRVGLDEWWVFDRESGSPESVRFSFAEAVMDVIELAEFPRLGVV